MKILITIEKNEIAPRFDLATEILIAESTGKKIKGEPRIILLPGSSGEDICGLAIKENVSLVVCGGIEDTHFQYLKWKKIKVIDGVIGPFEQALQAAASDSLLKGTVLRGAVKAGEHS